MPSNAIQLIDGRSEPEFPRAYEHARRRRADGAEHVGEEHEIVAEPGAGPADGSEGADDSVLARGRSRGFTIDAVHLLEQAAVVLRQADNHHFASGR